MPTKQDIITWLIVALICVLFFMLGCIRENNANGNANANSHINDKLKSNEIIKTNGNFILCDTNTLHNNSLGE